MADDPGLEALLNLNGESFKFEGGFTIEIVAWRALPSAGIPHGVRYSLTLHDRYGTRLMGYDNAHAVKPPKGAAKITGKRWPYDHRHRTGSDRGVPYEYRDAAQLLEDFFNDVERTIRKLRAT